MCINHIDDFGGAGAPDQAHHACQTLKFLLSELGLMDSPEKESLPATRMVFLSLLYDTIEMMVRVPEDKLMEIVSLVELWLWMHTATIKDLQSLLGKLLYACACISPGHILCSVYSVFFVRTTIKIHFRSHHIFTAILNWWFFLVKV